MNSKKGKHKEKKEKHKKETPMSLHQNNPPAIFPDELPDCEKRRVDFATGSPYLRFDLNLDVYFYNNQVDFATISEECASSGYRVISPHELVAISEQLARAGMCPMLVWTIHNGDPTLAYVFPGDLNPVRLVPPPSLKCRAYHFCTANNILIGIDEK